MIAIGDTPFLNAISEGMKIIEKNGMYGIIGKETGKEILPALYDYLKPHGVSLGIFTLRKDGRWGAVEIRENREIGDEKLHWIAPCEYDLLHPVAGLDLILSRKGEVLYYNYWNKTIAKYQRIELYAEQKYMFAEDEKYRYIFERARGVMLWRYEKVFEFYDMYGVPPISLVYMGDIVSSPVFYDKVSQRYLAAHLPHSIWLDWVSFEEPIKPIVVNGKSIVTIISNDDGIGVMEMNGRWDVFETDCRFQEIQVDLKVTMRDEYRTVEQYFPVPFERFTLSNISRMEEVVY